MAARFAFAAVIFAVPFTAVEVETVKAPAPLVERSEPVLIVSVPTFTAEAPVTTPV